MLAKFSYPYIYWFNSHTLSSVWCFISFCLWTATTTAGADYFCSRLIGDISEQNTTLCFREMLEVSVLGSHPPKSRPKSRSSTPPPQAKHPFQKCDQYGIKGIQKVRWCWSKNILQKQGGWKNTLVQVEKSFWSQNSLILITFSLLFLKSFALKSFSNLTEALTCESREKPTKTFSTPTSGFCWTWRNGCLSLAWRCSMPTMGDRTWRTWR